MTWVSFRRSYYKIFKIRFPASFPLHQARTESSKGVNIFILGKNLLIKNFCNKFINIRQVL